MYCRICKNEMIEHDIFYKCKGCGHEYRKYDGNIIEYHSKEYRKNFTRVSNEFDKDGKVTPNFHKARMKIVDGRLNLIRKYLKKEFSVLDIGSGAGTFANIIRNNVDNIECLELDKSLVNECIRLGFKTHSINFENLKIDKTYDIIFAWHVLEHIDDINLFVYLCYKYSNEYVIIEVPTRRSVPKRFDGHLHYFNEKSIKLLFEPHGFQLIEMCEGVQTPSTFAVFKKTK